MSDDPKTSSAPATDQTALSKDLSTASATVHVAQSAAQVAGVSSTGLGQAGQAVDVAQSATHFDGSASGMLGTAQSVAGLASALGAASPAVQAASKAISVAQQAWALTSKFDKSSAAAPGAASSVASAAGIAPDVNQQLQQHAFSAKDASSDFDDTHRLFRLYTGLPDAKRLFVHTLEGREAFNEMYELELELLSRSGDIDLKELTAQPMVVAIRQTDGSERLLSGYVGRFRRERINAFGWAVYTATLAPWTHVLTRNKDRRCMVNKTVRQVIEEIIQPYGPAAKFEFRLIGSYAPQSFIVQYQQSDWEFISYLIEQEGWTTFYEHAMDGQTLVITDDTVDRSRCPSLPLYDSIQFNGGTRVMPDNRVTDLHAVRETQPTRITLGGYDFQAPRNPMTVQIPTIAKQGEVPQVEVFDATPGYAAQTLAEHDRYARLRMEEREARAKYFEGHSDCPDLRPGGTTVVTSHPDFTAGEDDRLLITRVEHRGRNNFIGDPNEGPTTYTNTFHAIRQKVPYRPPLLQPRATVNGVQSATVTGPPGSEIWTNDDGCITVRFHWDRRARFDNTSSCWIRVARPLAGSGYGNMGTPRVGHEVLAEFYEGDPSRPVISLSLNNGDQKPPHPLPASGHMAGLRSNSTPGGGGYNELMMHDTKGSELLSLRSQKDLTSLALNDHTATVGHDHALHVTHDHSIAVGNTQATTVKKQITVQSVEANITAEAKTQITLTCGASSIQLNADGKVFISGTELYLNGKQIVISGTDSVDINSGAAAVPFAGPDQATSDEQVKGGNGGVAAARPANRHGSRPNQNHLVQTNLGSSVDDLLNKSPTLRHDYTTLKAQGWRIITGPANGGTFARRDNKTITVDAADMNDPNMLTQSLSHEFGHAMYSYREDWSSKSAYVNGALADEGAATINNIKAQREILANGGPDIGIAGNTDNQPAYNRAYDQFVRDGRASTARAAIGAIYGAGEKTSNTGQPYAEYYGSAYDEHPH